MVLRGKKSEMEVFSVVFAVLFQTCLLLVCFLILLSLHWRADTGSCRIQVVVLGDVGRSPRMQYHCLSLIQQNYSVDYVGYGGVLWFGKMGIVSYYR